MGVLRRMADARNTVEGKVLSVLMATLLVVSTFNVSAWAADKAEDTTSTDMTTEVNDKQEPAKAPEPEKPAAQPEPEKPAAQPEQLQTPAQRPEAEQPAAIPAPVEQKAADVALKLKIADATLAYGGRAVAKDATELVVPAGKDVRLTAKAADGFLLGEKAVKLVDAAGAESVIAPNAEGAYIIAADKVAAGATIVVSAEAVVAEEPEAPADEPATEPAEPTAPAEPATPATPEPATPTTPEPAEPQTPAAPTTEQPGTADIAGGIFGGSSTLGITDKNGNKNSAEIFVGDTLYLTGDSSYIFHSWTSDNDGVATVKGDKEKATVTGISSGTVTITHSSLVASETFTVTVVEASSEDLCTVTFSLGANDASWSGNMASKWEGTHRVPVGTVIAAKASDLGYPTRSGYVFAGWEPAISFTVVNDAEYTAQWRKSVSGYTPVYVYAKVDGDADGLTINKDGWYTIGVIMLPNSVFSNSGSNVNMNASVKERINEALKEINRFPANASINIDDITWESLHKVSDGASDYTGAASWHLDGKIKVERVSALQVNHYDIETGALISANNMTLNPGSDVVSADYQQDIKNYTYVSANPETATTVAGQTTIISLYYQRNAAKIIYDANGGMPSRHEEVYKAGDEATVANNMFDRLGYTFVGWNTEADGTGTSYATGAQIKLEEPATTLYAQWVVDQDQKFDYTVNYYIDGTTTPVPGIEPNPATGEGYLGEEVAISHPQVATGYKVKAGQPESLTIESTEAAGNTAVVYYEVDQDQKFAWRINYLEQGTDAVVAPAAEGTGYLTQQVSQPNPEVYGFSVADGSLSTLVTISQTEGVNEVTVYYVRDNFTINATIDSNGTISGNANQTVLYQGASQPISFSANPGYRIDSVVITETTADGEVVRNLTPTGTALDYTFDAIDGVEGNYVVRVTTAPLDAVTLTVPSATKTYDGQALAAQPFTVNGLPEGYAVTGNVIGSRTNVGTTIASVDLDSIVIRDAAGADVTDRFRSTLHQTVGTLTVNPAAVTVTASNATKVAGAADPALTATVSGLVNGESADLISYTVSRAAGEDVGDYAVTPAGAANQGNYAVTYVPGTLTITAAPVVPPTPVTPTPVTPAPAGPAPAAAAVVPAAAAVVPAAAETIADDATPLAYAGADDAVPEAIEDDATPMAAFDHPHCWVHHWIFLGIFLTLVYAIGVIARRMNYVRKIDKFEDDLTGGQATGDVRAAKPVIGGMEA